MMPGSNIDTAIFILCPIFSEAVPSQHGAISKESGIQWSCISATHSTYICNWILNFVSWRLIHIYCVTSLCYSCLPLCLWVILYLVANWINITMHWVSGRNSCCKNTSGRRDISQDTVCFFNCLSLCTTSTLVSIKSQDRAD